MPGLCLQGRFSMSARYHNNIAEIYEGELADYEQVIASIYMYMYMNPVSKI